MNPRHATTRAGEDRIRVAALDAYGVLEHPPTEELQSLVDLTARICGVPVAQLNLFTEDEQRQVAAHGLDAADCRRDDSMCAVVLGEPGTIVVPDARADARFADNPFVNGALGEARFYASHPLVSTEGVIVGRLCVADLEPHSPEDLDGSVLSSLGVIADRVMEMLELGLRTRQLDASLRRVEDMRAALQASHDRLAAFAGQVSHDLKTPLSSVAASLELIRDQLDEEPSDGDVCWLADKALSGVGRMTALVDDVLAYALVGGSGTHAPVDLHEVVDEVLSDLDDALHDARVRVGTLPAVRGDRTQLASLVQNLIGNAAKYRSTERPLEVRVTATRRDAVWVVEFADNGRGVAIEDRARIFEPLTRADTTVDGSGIGLATCRRVVAAHGGEIGLRSTPGGGTTFWVELPAG